MDFIHALLTARCSSSTGPRVTAIKREVAPNVHVTLGVILSLDNVRYLLPISMLQDMNHYQLHNHKMPHVFAPFSLEKHAFECDDESLRPLIDKHFRPRQNLHEQELRLLPCKDGGYLSQETEDDDQCETCGRTTETNDNAAND